MVINSTNLNSIDGKDEMLSSFQSETWIKDNLQWDFNSVWKISDENSIYIGLPIFKTQNEEPNNPTSNKNIELSNNVLIHFNSNNNTINVNHKADRIKIYNQTGTCIISENDVENINVSSLSNDIYIIQVSINGKTTTQKIIKK